MGCDACAKIRNISVKPRFQSVPMYLHPPSFISPAVTSIVGRNYLKGIWGSLRGKESLFSQLFSWCVLGYRIYLSGGDLFFGDARKVGIWSKIQNLKSKIQEAGSRLDVQNCPCIRVLWCSSNCLKYCCFSSLVFILVGVAWIIVRAKEKRKVDLPCFSPCVRFAAVYITI